jgi:hypothetical protein
MGVATNTINCGLLQLWLRLNTGLILRIHGNIRPSEHLPLRMEQQQELEEPRQLNQHRDLL